MLTWLDVPKWLIPRVQVDAVTRCWEWLRYRDLAGYGRTVGGMTAHRWVWRKMGREVGDRASGDVLHHRCGNRACVNPDHLEVRQRGEHMREHAVERPRLTEEERQRNRRVASQSWRERRRAAGGCRQCLELALPGKQVCAAHLEAERATARRRRERWKLAAAPSSPGTSS